MPSLPDGSYPIANADDLVRIKRYFADEYEHKNHKFAFLPPAKSYSSARITGRRHLITGEWIAVEPWVNQIHPEDWDWFQRHWDWVDAFDFKVRREIAIGT